MSLICGNAAPFKPLLGCMAGLACLLGIAAGTPARAQAGPDAIYGVTGLDVAPKSAAKGVAILKQYRDSGAQAGRQSGRRPAAGGGLAQPVHRL